MKTIFITLVVIAIVLGGFLKLAPTPKVSEIVYQNQVQEVIVDSYDQRVEELVASTTEEWKEKHRNWAEQEVTKQLVTENEERLKVLRQEELSF